jgi:hypothetical protein
MRFIIPVLLMFLFFYFFIALIIGLIKPAFMIRWGKIETRNRFKVLKVYGLGSIFALLFLIISAIAAPSTGSSDKKIASTADNKQVSEETTEKVKTKVEKTEAEIAAEKKAAAEDAKKKAAVHGTKVRGSASH